MIRITILISCALLLYIIPLEVSAGIYDIENPADRSRYYLGLIFGSNIATVSLGGAANRILPLMFEIFNTIIVSVGVAIISYIGIVSTVNTASEGQILGQKLSTAWTPIKIILGLLLMAPTPGSGYSMIQATVMWVVLQGAGAANEVWGIVLDNLAQGISVTSNNSVAPLERQGKKIAQEILYALVCQEALQEFQQTPRTLTLPGQTAIPGVPLSTEEPSAFVAEFGSQISTFVESNRVSGISPDQDFSDDTYTYGDNYNIGIPTSDFNLSVINQYGRACGQINIEVFSDEKNTGGETSESDLRSAALERYSTVLNAVQLMFNYLRPTAEKIVSGEITADSAKDKTDSNTTSVISIKSLAIDAYASALSELGNPPPSNTQDKITKAKSDGWIHAGNLYFVLSGLSSGDYSSDIQSSTPTAESIPQPPANENEKDADDPSSIKNNDFLRGQLTPLEQRDLNLFLRTAKTVYEIDDDSAAAAGLFAVDTENCSIIATADGEETVCTKAPDSFDAFMSGLFAIVNEIEAALLDIFKIESGDPITAMRTLGNGFMMAIEILWAVTAALVFLLMIPMGTCHIFNPAVHGMRVMMLALGTVIIAIMGALWSLGATLAIYIPMIPFMIFTVAALGWMVSVIEAIIAAPVIALGIVTPSGDELGKSVQGVSLLAGIFLRPTLMVIGFLLAAKLLSVVVSMINFSMQDVLVRYTGSGILILPALVLKISIYVIVVMALTNKCFSLIHIIPNKVLRWIGGAAEQTFGESILSETRQQFDKAASASSGVLTGAATAATSAASQKIEQKQQAANEAKQRENAADKELESHFKNKSKTKSAAAASPVAQGGDAQAADDQQDADVIAGNADTPDEKANKRIAKSKNPLPSEKSKPHLTEEEEAAQAQVQEPINSNISNSERNKKYNISGSDKAETQALELAFYHKAVERIRNANSIEEVRAIRAEMVGNAGFAPWSFARKGDQKRRELFSQAAIAVTREVPPSSSITGGSNDQDANS